MDENSTRSPVRWLARAGILAAAIALVVCGLALAASGTVTSNLTARDAAYPPPIPPRNTVAPVASGTVEVGQKISATAGSWSGTPPLVYSYQWQLCARRCTNIPRGTSSTLTLAAKEVGERVRVLVTAANTAGRATASSNRLGPVLPSASMVRAALRAFTVKRKHGIHGPFVLKFAAPSAGRLRVSFYYLPPGAHLARATAANVKPVLVATAAITTHRPGRAKTRLSLTANGRSLLETHAQLAVKAPATFTPAGGRAVEVTRSIEL